MERNSEQDRSRAACWRRLPLRSEERNEAGLLVRILEKSVPALAGRTLFFFSDTHFQERKVRNLRGRGTLPEWQGTDQIGKALNHCLEIFRPEWIVFGGDLCGEAVSFPDAFRLLSGLSAPFKIAVPGNWDRKRRWISVRRFRSEMQKSGFHLLCNEWMEAGGILFRGTDDFKLGRPVYDPVPEGKEGLWSCLVSHNPDTPGRLTPEEVRDYRFIFCGHTHGGQVRIPGIGAVITSSRFGKRFEKGLYRHSCGTEMFVSSGIGTTWFPVRFRCPPEVLVIRFRKDQILS